MDFLFRLGFSRQLAELELSSILGYQPQKISDDQYLVSLSNLPRLNEVANRLGGLIEAEYADSHKIVWRHSARYWYQQDRNKPYADPRKGLLPPKIARQLVNIAIGTEIDPDRILLDPFCGSGTILLEAAHLGLKVIGTEIDDAQLSGAKKNLDWGHAKCELVKADATGLDKRLKSKVDYIVTEPFMGKTRFKPGEQKNIAKGLHKLYLGALKNWLKILNPKGRVVMFFPIFQSDTKQIITSNVVDQPALSGYNVLARNIIYSQPRAQVKRETIILEKK